MTAAVRARLREIYIGAVIVSAAALLVAEAVESRDEPWDVVGTLALLVAMTAAERLSVAMRGTQVSVATIPHMVAILLLPTHVAMALAGTAMLIDQLAARATIRKVLFNVASVLLTVGVAALTADHVGLDRSQLALSEEWRQVFGFLVVAAIYYFMTNLLVAIVLSLTDGEPPHRIFLENARFALPAEFGVCGIGGLVAVLWTRSPAWAPLLLFPVVTAQAALTYIASSKRNNARLAFLAEASRVMALSLDEQELASRVVHVAVPTLGDACLMFLRESDGAFRLVAIDEAERAPPPVRSIGGDVCAAPAVKRWLTQIVESGRQSHLTELFTEPLTTSRRTPAELGPYGLLGVPLVLGDRYAGALVCATSVWRRAYTAADVALAEDLARRCAISLDNARLYREAQKAQQDLRDLNERLERRVHERTLELEGTVRRLKGLSDVSRTVTSNLDLAEVLTAIVVRAVDLSGADDGFVFQYDPAAQALVYRTSCGLSDGPVAELEARQGLPISAPGVMGRAARRLETVEVPDVDDGQAEWRAGAEDDEDIRMCQRDGMRAMLVLPMVRSNALAGVLTVRRRNPGNFSVETIELLETFAAQSTVSIHDARLFQQLQEERAALEVANRHKSDFLASMSHEFRTPLNAIIGFSEVLLDHPARVLPEEQRATFVSHIHRSGQHLLGLINNILDLSKVEAGHMELHRESVVLAEVIEDCVSMMRVMAGSKSINVDGHCQPCNVVVSVDVARLKQIVYNLLSNAVKFTPDGGHVTVAARAVGHNVLVSVQDDGIGIRAEDHELIFAAFRQAAVDGPRTIEGTGLGLALVRNLVELHGGQIRVDSAPGDGSCFTFDLPACVVA